MGAAEKEANMSPYCPSSTNWHVADGSLEGSISLDTSSSSSMAEAIPIGVLLERPADSRPCEITVFFKEKHEIHSIYVRSTARVYEIYYASDEKVNSNEYLCTVRCGAALQETTANVCERALAECKVSNDVNAVLPRSDGNNTVEDGWVNVEVPDSLIQDNRRFSLSNTSEANISPKTQIHYEATAEISDASPCMSVTLRLLSHQTKATIHVEEIYIYADPVEDIDPDPPVSNVGAGSLLSMLVPGLLQVSKSGNHRLQDGLSDVLGGSVHGSCPDMSDIRKVEASSVMGKVGLGLDQQHREVKLEHLLMSSRNKVTDTDQVSKPKIDVNNLAHDCVQNVLDKPVEKQHAQTKPADGQLRSTEEEKGLDQSRKAINDETNTAHARLEKILDDLVSRVGRIEIFCSSFQENILKPLTGIDTRLQRMEEQLDALTKRPQSSEIHPCTRISTPEFSGHESDSENKCCLSSLVMMESDCHEKEALVDKLAVSIPELQKGSGLVVKAPEFPYGDGDDDDVESSNSGYDFVYLRPKEYTRKEKCLHIDSALASALSAFITSTSDKSSVHNNSDLMDVPNEKQNSAEHILDSAAVALHSEVTNNSFLECVLGHYEVMNEAHDELCQGGESCSNDIMNTDNSLNEFDMYGCTETERQDYCLCDESLLADDDSSAEVDTNDPKGMIIRAPEFPNEDDIIDCGESCDPHKIFYPGAHSHTLSDAGSIPALALFLSSRRVSTTKCSPNSHHDPSKLPTADNYNFSLSAVQAHRGSDDVISIRHECSSKTEADSSLLGFFLSQGVSEQENMDSYHDTEIHGGETSSFGCQVNIMEDVNHVLKCDGFHCNGMSTGSAIRQNLLPCSVLHSDSSIILGQDEKSWVSDFKLQNAAIMEPMLDMLGRFEADSCTTTSSDGIFLDSKLHLEYFDSRSMDVGAFSVIDEHIEQTADNSGSSETTAQCQSIGISQMDSLIGVKHLSSFISGQDDFISNVNFCTDKNLRSWLPLEVLLGEKIDAEEQSLDQVEVVFSSVPDQENSASNSKLCADGDLRSGLPLEKEDDQVENNDYNNDTETGHSASNSKLCADGDLRSSLPLEKEDDQVENNDYNNDTGTGHSASNSKLCPDGDLRSGLPFEKEDQVENNDYNNDTETGQQCSSLLSRRMLLYWM